MNSHPEGIPAISPTKPGTPAFTIEDAKQYLKHPFAPKDWPPSVIEKVEFITSREASMLMQGASIGVPDDELVCYAKLRVERKADSGGEKASLFRNVEFIFDAQTGNLLLWSQ